MLVEAGQPEILRAAQRDDTFKKQLSENVSDILRLLFGVQFWIKYKNIAEVLSPVLYQLLTTMSNVQTLGEEYTGMVQVDSSGKSLPKKYLQFLMIFLNNSGEKVVNETLKRIKNSANELPINNSARIEVLKIANILRTCVPLILKFHKGLFYMNGHYHEISKRMCGIKYILIRYWLKDRSSISAFKLLGIITLLQSILNIISAFINCDSFYEEKLCKINVANETDKVEASEKCPLCLNNRQQTSVTPCGHLFCWSCIIPWLQEQSKCPLCRMVCQPSRVVFLQNYSTSS